MSFDISKLTNAVNKYLNSISDGTSAARRASQEIEDRTRFANELGDAIKQNMTSRLRDNAATEIPDISAQIQNEIKQATSGFDATIEQINGAFEAIKE